MTRTHVRSWCGALTLVSAFGLVACSKHAESSKPKVLATATEKELQGIARTALDSPTPTPAQLERRRKNTALVASMGLPTLETLPVVEDEATIKPRPLEEVSSRCLATELCAVKGEVNDQKLGDEIAATLGGKELLSPAEKVFFEAPAPSPQDLADFAWRYECVHVFLWALGYVPELAPPNKIADVAKEAALIRDEGAANLAKHAHLRPLGQILDQNDLYYRLHWAAVELGQKGTPSPAVDAEIVQERHRALNWLIRYQGQAWDEVTTDT